MHRSAPPESAVVRRVPLISFVPRLPGVSVVKPGHVPGLYLLCAVELFERLASMMVFSLLVLYLNECLGFGTGSSAKIANYVNVLSYLAGVLGGLLADRGLGALRAVLGGVVLLALGYAALGVAHGTLSGLWAALVITVAGHGLFKPNMAALLGGLYLPFDPRRVSAFAFFYYAANGGALLGPLVGGILRTSLGWSVTFHVSAVCIVFAAILLTIGNRCLSSKMSTTDFNRQTAPEPTPALPFERSSSSRVAALVLALAILAVFGAALSQSYGTLLLWARDDARRTMFGQEIPPDFFAALPAAFVLLFGPLLERSEKTLAARGRLASQASKFTVGMLLCALAYGLMLTESLWHRGPSLANPMWLVACKVALAIGELLGVPVGIALVESLAPPRNKGLSMGLCYLAHALGYWLGGEVSAMWPQWSHARFFAVLALGCLTAAALIQSQSGRFSRLMLVKL